MQIPDANEELVSHNIAVIKLEAATVMQTGQQELRKALITYQFFPLEYSRVGILV